jgi:hypothetical protein
MALAAPIGGLIIVKYGYPPIFILGAFFYMLTIVILWVKFGRGKRSGYDEQETAESMQEIAN